MRHQDPAIRQLWARSAVQRCARVCRRTLLARGPRTSHTAVLSKADLNELRRRFNWDVPEDRAGLVLYSVGVELFLRPTESLTLLFGDFDYDAETWHAAAFCKTSDGSDVVALFRCRAGCPSAGLTQVELLALPHSVRCARAVDATGNACVRCVIAAMAGYAPHGGAPFEAVVMAARGCTGRRAYAGGSCEAFVSPDRVARAVRRAAEAVNAERRAALEHSEHEALEEATTSSTHIPMLLPVAYLRNYSPRHIAFTHRMNEDGCRWVDVFRDGRLRKGTGVKVLTNHYWNHDHPDDPRMMLTAAFGSLAHAPQVSRALAQLGLSPASHALTPLQARKALVAAVEDLLQRAARCTLEMALTANAHERECVLAEAVGLACAEPQRYAAAASLLCIILHFEAPERSNAERRRVRLETGSPVEGGVLDELLQVNRSRGNLVGRRARRLRDEGKDASSGCLARMDRHPCPTMRSVTQAHCMDHAGGR